MKNTKRVEVGDIPPSFLYRVEKKIAELEKRKIKHLINFWAVVQKLTEIQQKINILRNTKKIKKNKYKEKDILMKRKEWNKMRREINNKKWMI